MTTDPHPYDAFLPVPFGPTFYAVSTERDHAARCLARSVLNGKQHGIDTFSAAFAALDAACSHAQTSYHQPYLEVSA